MGSGADRVHVRPAGGHGGGRQRAAVRTAVKQICRRLGYHATFMARPAFPDFFSTGWHLHQSLRSRRRQYRQRVHGPRRGADGSPTTGPMWLAGLLEHAVAGSRVHHADVTGYKRYRPDSFAPDRVAWADENRGALLRVIGEPDRRHAHREPGRRLGSQPLPLPRIPGRGRPRRPAATARPPRPVAEPYTASATPLPRSLMDAVTSCARTRSSARLSVSLRRLPAAHQSTSRSTGSSSM